MEPVAKTFAVDPDSGRELRYVGVECADDLRAEMLPPRPFVCLLAWNAEGQPVDVLARVTGTLLDAGCAYACCYGSGCERVHDVADEELVGRTVLECRQWPVVMTTWHTHETLDDVLHFFLRNTSLASGGDGHPEWEAPAAHALALEIGDVLSPRAALFTALADPVAFAAAYREHG